MYYFKSIAAEDMLEVTKIKSNLSKLKCNLSKLLRLDISMLKVPFVYYILKLFLYN